MHEKWNLPWIFEIDTNFHHFLHGFWKLIRGVFRFVFGSAFSKKGRCCKVQHARILWFLQWILTVFKFYVFLAKAKKERFWAEFRCKKRNKFWPEIPRKSDGKNHGIFSKNQWKFASGPVLLAISLPLATLSCHEARCRGPMPRGNGHEAARGT